MARGALAHAHVHERAKQHIGKLCYFSDQNFASGGVGPAKLSNVGRIGNMPYQSESGDFWAKFKLADPQPVATPEPEPVYEWIDDKYHFDGKVIGGIYQIYNGEWFAVCQPSQYDWRNHFEMTPSHARAWVEAQFNNPKP